MTSAEAEPARKIRVWYFLAASGPAMSEYVLRSGSRPAPIGQPPEPQSHGSGRRPVAARPQNRFNTEHSRSEACCIAETYFLKYS